MKHLKSFEQFLFEFKDGPFIKRDSRLPEFTTIEEMKAWMDQHKIQIDGYEQYPKIAAAVCFVMNMVLNAGFTIYPRLQDHGKMRFILDQTQYNKFIEDIEMQKHRHAIAGAFSIPANAIYINTQSYLIDGDRFREPDEVVTTFNADDEMIEKVVAEIAKDVSHRDNLQTIFHEIGHYLHFNGDKDGYRRAEAMDRDWHTPRRIAPEIGSQVSNYGSTQWREFIAEVFAGICLGVEYSNSVMSRYASFGGPMTNEIAKFIADRKKPRWRTKDKWTKDEENKLRRGYNKAHPMAKPLPVMEFKPGILSGPDPSTKGYVKEFAQLKTPEDMESWARGFGITLTINGMVNVGQAVCWAIHRIRRAGFGTNGLSIEIDPDGSKFFNGYRREAKDEWGEGTGRIIDPIGTYDYMSNKVWINGTSPDFEGDRLNRITRGTHSSSDEPGAVIIHELAHALHKASLGGGPSAWRLLRYGRGMYSEEHAKDLPRPNFAFTKFYYGNKAPKEGEGFVSDYGMTNWLEFVAEVFTGIVLDKTYDDEVMKWYAMAKGPMTPEIEKYIEFNKSKRQ